MGTMWLQFHFGSIWAHLFYTRGEGSKLNSEYLKPQLLYMFKMHIYFVVFINSIINLIFPNLKTNGQLRESTIIPGEVYL